MSKELRELLARLDAAKTEVRSLLGENRVDEAEKKMEEVRNLQKQIEIQRALEEQEKTETRQGTEVQTISTNDDVEFRDVFFKAIRNRPLTAEEMAAVDEIRAMSGLTGEDGGLVIPQDIQTRINELARSFDALEQYVRVETVNTRSGSRVLEKNSDMVPFAEVDEMGEIPETDNPKFTKIDYNVKDRAGILPLSRTLLQDSDQNIQKYLENWLSKKSKVTRNVLILNVLKTLPKKTIADIDDIKDVINVDLDPAISANAIVLTNQDGFNYLDKLKDQEGKYILQPDPTNATRKLLFGVHLVVKVSNRFLPTDKDTNKAPIIIGDLQEAVVLFKREEFELKATDVGGDAFKRNTLDLRVIQRDDVKVWDDEAAVFGEIDLTPVV